MNWDQILELHKSEFVEIGNHSHSHEYLADEGPEVIKDDILQSIEIFKNKTKKDIEYIKLFNLLGIITTFIGFLWFLIKFPDPGAGDTIKAVYVIQLFYFMAFLSIAYLNNLRKKSFTKYRYVIISLIFVFFHIFSS